MKIRGPYGMCDERYIQGAKPRVEERYGECSCGEGESVLTHTGRESLPTKSDL